MKQLTATSRASVSSPTSPQAPASASPSPSPSTVALPVVTRFRDPSLPYEDLIQCERDCMRCSYAMTLDCDGNCGSCPRQSYCPCVNPAKVRTKNFRIDGELSIISAVGRD